MDIVGEALNCLVIARLPFAVPTDPSSRPGPPRLTTPSTSSTCQTRSCASARVWRLIRSADDFGLVVVLDKRLLTKSYGKTILRLSAWLHGTQGPIRLLPDLARRWLDPANRG